MRLTRAVRETAGMRKSLLQSFHEGNGEYGEHEEKRKHGSVYEVDAKTLGSAKWLEF